MPANKRAPARGTAFEQDDPLLDTPASADFLGVQPHTMAVWRSTGRYDLPYVLVGSLIRYRRSALEAFINRRTRSGHAMSFPPDMAASEPTSATRHKATGLLRIPPGQVRRGACPGAKTVKDEDAPSSLGNALAHADVTTGFGAPAAARQGNKP